MVIIAVTVGMVVIIVMWMVLMVTKEGERSRENLCVGLEAFEREEKKQRISSELYLY